MLITCGAVIVCCILCTQYLYRYEMVLAEDPVFGTMGTGRNRDTQMVQRLAVFISVLQPCLLRRLWITRSEQTHQYLITTILYSTVLDYNYFYPLVSFPSPFSLFPSFLWRFLFSSPL